MLWSSLTGTSIHCIKEIKYSLNLGKVWSKKYSTPRKGRTECREKITT